MALDHLKKLSTMSPTVSLAHDTVPLGMQMREDEVSYLAESNRCYACGHLDVLHRHGFLGAWECQVCHHGCGAALLGLNDIEKDV
jgi:hypothetical protein